MVRKNVRNFAPSKRKMRIPSRPKKLLLFNLIQRNYEYNYLPRLPGSTTQRKVLSQPTNCLFLLRKHRDGRQNASANGRSSPTADRVHDAAGRCTLTVDKVLATIAEILRRPTEYFRSKGKQKISALMLKIVNG